MVAEVRRLLESYDFNVSHSANVSGSGITDSNVFTCNPKGLHIGDLTETNGKITEISENSITVSIPFAEDVNHLKVEVYDYVSDEWLNNTWEDQIRPMVEQYVPLEEKTVEEFHSGIANGILALDNRNVNEILEIEGGYFTRIDRASGILKGSFPKGEKNIRVKYTYGGEMKSDVKRACVMLIASVALGFIGSSTGGGSLNVQGYGRNYGARGKYNDIRSDFERWAYTILRRYQTGMVQV